LWSRPTNENVVVQAFDAVLGRLSTVEIKVPEGDGDTDIPAVAFDGYHVFTTALDQSSAATSVYMSDMSSGDSKQLSLSSFPPESNPLNLQFGAIENQFYLLNLASVDNGQNVSFQVYSWDYGANEVQKIGSPLDVNPTFVTGNAQYSMYFVSIGGTVLIQKYDIQKEKLGHAVEFLKSDYVPLNTIKVVS
jgi:hypothetical protein